MISPSTSPARRSVVRRSRAWPLLLVAGLTAAAQVPVEFDMVRNFKLPEYDEKTGDLRSIIRGQEAKVFRKSGYADMKDMTIDVYRDNVVETVVSSPACRLHLTKGVATSDEVIHIRRDDLEVTGRGYTWNRDQQVFEIRNKARVTLKGARIEMFNPVREEKENDAKPNS